MHYLDEAMDERLERLERENEQLRADKQKLLDALGPYAMASWIHHSVHEVGRATYQKLRESMTWTK